MKKNIEKITILLLSFIVTSSYAISSVVPKMLEYFDTYPRSQVEILVSVPSFFIMMTVLLNTWLSRVISERVGVVTGILLMAFGGTIPVYIQEYWVVLISRVILGVGIGMINGRAITIIQDRYEGEERARLLGVRGSMEVLGSTVLALAAGYLLTFGWNYAFLLYLVVVPVLILYIFFVSDNPNALTVEDQPGFSFGEYGKYVFSYVCFGWILICAASSNSIRIPSLITESGYGTGTDASLVLSFMNMMGMVAGFSFGTLEKKLKEKLIIISLLMIALGDMIIAHSGSLLMVGAGAALAGAFNSILSINLFHQMSAVLPKVYVASATSIVLVGCNFGSACSSFVLKGIDAVFGSIRASFGVYAVVMVLLAIAFPKILSAKRWQR